MEIIPAIRLRGGACAGAAGQEAEPAQEARRLQEAGAPALHLVEEDSLERGRLARLLDILDVLMAVSIPVQVRAGLRGDEEIGQVLSRGAARAVVEAEAMETGRLSACAARFGVRVVAALDLAPPWEPAGARARAQALRAAGFQRILCRARPVPEGGPAPDPVKLLPEIAAAGLPLIWEGGPLTLARIRVLAALPGVEGVVLDPSLEGGELSVAAACVAAQGG